MDNKSRKDMSLWLIGVLAVFSLLVIYLKYVSVLGGVEEILGISSVVLWVMYIACSVIFSNFPHWGLAVRKRLVVLDLLSIVLIPISLVSFNLKSMPFEYWDVQPMFVFIVIEFIIGMYILTMFSSAKKSAKNVKKCELESKNV